jgi:hypothetical protein
MNYVLLGLLMTPVALQAQNGDMDNTFSTDMNTFLTPSMSNESTTSLRDVWSTGTWSLNYLANFDYADKGGIGFSMDCFMAGGSPIGLSWGFQGLYNLATEKWCSDGFGGFFGPNVAFPLSENFLLYAPVCATCTSYTNIDGDIKSAWGASVVPSIGIKMGNLFVSAGWYLSYSFKTSKSNSDSFFVNIGLFFND